MTSLDTFFTADEFQQLLFFCAFKVNSNQRIKTPEPAILKPKALWTGKQVISAMLNHLLLGRAPLTMDGTTQVPAIMWGRDTMEVRHSGEVSLERH